MKYISLFTLLFLLSYHLQGQDDVSKDPIKKNSIGFSISSQDIGPGFIKRDAPTVKLDYRRFLKNDLELRFSLGYQHEGDTSPKNSGYSVALGLNKFLFQNDKFSIYAGAELSYERYSLISGSNAFGQPGSEIMNPIRSVAKVSLLMGFEYKPTSRLSLFLEPELMQFSIMENDGQSVTPALTYFRALNGTQAGMKYRF